MAQFANGIGTVHDQPAQMMARMLDSMSDRAFSSLERHICGSIDRLSFEPPVIKFFLRLQVETTNARNMDRRALVIFGRKLKTIEKQGKTPILTPSLDRTGGSLMLQNSPFLIEAESYD